jgi:ribosome maturation factor RimP
MPHSQLLENLLTESNTLKLAGMGPLREKHPVVLKIEDEVEQTLASHGYELVQITYGGHGRARTLTVYIDKSGGVSADDCHNMAAQISVLLDIMDPISHSYNLVVSSPGVERPLVRKDDYKRFVGKPAAITFEGPEGRQTREGNLLGMDNDSVLLETQQEVLHIHIETIDRAHLLYDGALGVD